MSKVVSVDLDWEATEEKKGLEVGEGSTPGEGKGVFSDLPVSY